MPLRVLFFLLLFLSITGLTAQVDSLGEWRTLQSYRFGTYVTESPESIIYTTGKAIFYLDKEDLSISRLAREDGLAEARIRLLRYHPPTETLIIVYESSVIDLLRNGRFTTLRQIDNFNFSGDKTIYDLHFDEGENIVYLAAGFGVSALSLDDETFLFTTFTGVRVDGAALHEGLLYAATEEGIYRAPRLGTNLNDFGNWELLGAANGFPEDYTSTAINIYKDELYFGIEKDVYRLQADTAALFFDTNDERPWRLQYLSVGPTYLLAGYQCQDDGCSSRQLIMLTEEGQQRRVFNQCIIRSNYAIEDDQGRFWFAEDKSTPRIRYLEGIDDGDCNEIEYNGPLDDTNYRLLHDGTSLWVAPGVLDENFSPNFSFGGVYRFKDGDWVSFNRNNNDVFKGRNGEVQGDDDVAEIVDVHYDEVNQRYWFSSFFEGAISFDEETEEGELFDETNSSLQLSDGAGPGRVRVAGAVTDQAGFTYLANSKASEGNFISVRSPEGEWAALAGGCTVNDALAIEIDPQGYIWTVHATSVGGGLTVLDPMGTPMDPTDDRCRTITANNSNLPTNNVRSIAVDLDGNVWVGTSQGIVLFECGASAFDTGICPGRLPIVEADDFGGFLLETEEIRSITVDGGNRKWIGTSGGAYLLSDDGEDQLLFFDQGNSPLLDNIVRDIAIHPTTGVVYFGTELGIISYRAEATEANRRTFKNELTIFPNPVEPGEQSPIAINGLARDARVKITDLSGKLVAEGTATGGQFVWSGTDYTGRRVTSGVYLVLASTNGRFGLNDPQAAVGKIVFLR
ncbi:type IX secretion system anionic LPS delivery protein PorZ [Neolewinella agarilytica]|uniref:Two component regulator propeller n=1 Tax=Neolewinella agarilytica TaxID=478744 RepID=A0A1H9L4X7_9BACT|nr:two-component regulator propeller domain-containing protein [Neolewinella agarilytica]SER06551.1 Two component regulator propeller [Neolewinella agarilytica]